MVAWLGSVVGKLGWEDALFPHQLDTCASLLKHSPPAMPTLLQVLSTRVYRGGAPAADAAGAPDAGCSGGCGLSVVALGGAAVLESGAAWEMESCWVEEEEADA